MNGSKRIESADVVVVGGGSAGASAAISAARAGASVLLVEAGNCLGGTSTAGGVTGWFASLDGLGDVFDDVKDLLERFGARYGEFFNTEYLKIVWQHLAERAGVRILFHAQPLSAEVSNGRIQSLDVLARAHTIRVTGRVFIDATGEGDLSAIVGAEFMQGDPEHGRTLHMSLTAMLFDTGSPVTPYLPEGLVAIQSDDDLPGLNANIRLPDGRIYLNMTKVIGHDPTDPFSLSDAECEARRQLARVVHYLQRTKYPTYMIGSTGARIGIREGRRVLGDYVITESDIVDGHAARFTDGVAVATCQIDFHSLTRPGHVGWRKRVQPYPIPYRSLVVKGFDNLLVAGKCISGDQVAQSSYRMTPTCVGMGQAAGTAAALAVRHGLASFRDVPIDALRGELANHGVQLDPARHAMYPPSDRQETPNRSNAD